MVEVLWENRQALLLFDACATQWCFSPMGQVLGLSYPALASTMQMMKVRRTRDALWRVRILESAALPILNRKK